MNHLKQVLIEVAEAAPELCWPSDIRLAVPDASDMAVRDAVRAMRLWTEADNPVSRAFAGHALDTAVRHLRVRVVA
jgi:hypothetical protein